MENHGSMKSDLVMDAEKLHMDVRPGEIFGLIQKAMQKVGAIGKDSYNTQQKFKYRGIDAVYNALNPVMADLGLFICPEVLGHKREERQTLNGGRLIYSILTIRYTIFAPDGSYVSCTVIGEGMDSGDKASNKAMSVAMKYAMFQLLMIPTEEMIDPDGECHTVAGEAVKPYTPPVNAPTGIVAGMQILEGDKRAKAASQGATVEKAETLPQVAQAAQAAPQASPKKPTPTETQVYLMKAMKQLREDRGITVRENNTLFADQLKALIGAKLAPDKRLESYTMKEAEDLIDAMYKNFPPTSAELIKK